MRTLSVLVLASIGALAMPIHAQVVLSNTTIYTAPPGSFPSFGSQLALAESNGDGALDLYVVDSQVDTNGRAYVLAGPSYASAILVNIPPPIWGLGLGFALADLNEDGNSDIVLGSPNTGDGTMNLAGRVLISYSPTFQSTIELVRPAPSYPGGDSFGSGIAVDDYDLDGKPDLFVGAPSALVAGFVNAGQVHVYFGSSGYTALPNVTLNAPHLASTRAWGSVISIADFDVDGHQDLLTQSNFTQSDSPRIGFGFFPSMDPVPLVQFGPPLATVGFALGTKTRVVDLDGNGYPDILASDPIKSGGGQVLVFNGPSFQNPSFLMPPGQSSAAGSGYGLSHGDVDRDGTIDIVVGSPYDKSGNLTKNGRVTIFFGPDFVNTQSVYGQYSQSRFGQGVAVHDFDGDGYGEILVACGGEWGGGSLHLLKHESLSLQTANTVSLSAGGTVKFAIQRGKLAAGAPYLMLMSASGSTPGLQIPFAGGSVHLPLNFDAATLFGLQFVNSGVFVAFQGVLDTKGEAVPRFVVPGGVNEPALFGLPLAFAAVLGEAGPYISATTNAKVVTLGP